MDILIESKMIIIDPQNINLLNGFTFRSFKVRPGKWQITQINKRIILNHIDKPLEKLVDRHLKIVGKIIHAGQIGIYDESKYSISGHFCILPAILNFGDINITRIISDKEIVAMFLTESSAARTKKAAKK